MCNSVKFVICFLLFLTAGFSTHSKASRLPETITLPSQLQSVLSTYQSAWQSGDAKAIASLFAQNGFVLANGKIPIQGQEQIEAFYANSGSPIILRPFAYQVGERLAFILGGITKADLKHDLAKFTLVLGKTKTGWEILSDMDNRNAKAR